MLSKTIFSSVSLGVSPNYKPSNVQVVTLAGGSHGFSHTGFSASKMGVDFNTEFGFETVSYTHLTLPTKA